MMLPRKSRAGQKPQNIATEEFVTYGALKTEVLRELSYHPSSEDVRTMIEQSRASVWPAALLGALLAVVAVASGLSAAYYVLSPKLDSRIRAEAGYQLSQLAIPQIIKDYVDYKQSQENTPAPPGKISVTLGPGLKCWIQTTNDGLSDPGRYEGPGTIYEGSEPITIRDGCPGRLEFRVGGQLVHPENRAINKSKVELVELP